MIREGWRENVRRKGKRQRSKAANLLRRLEEHRDEVLRFLHDFAVPFTNNEIEGDLQMTKLHEKISVGWRSMRAPAHSWPSAATWPPLASRARAGRADRGLRRPALDARGGRTLNRLATFDRWAATLAAAPECR